MEAEKNRRLGFIELAPGVTPRHALSYLFAAFVSIGLFTYLVALTPFILKVNLAIPESEQGRLSGMLQFWQEIVLLAVIGWWGALSDRIGRRKVYIAAFLLVALAYMLYPLARTPTELLIYRMVFGIAVAGTAAMLATVLADYPVESSRGKMTGVSFFLNGLGAVLFFVLLSRLPKIYESMGATEIEAGRYAYWTAAGIALLAALVMLGLKPGVPSKVSEHKPLLTLAAEGLKAARNPRIALAYGGGFTSRADMSLITLFLALWASQAAIADGYSPAQAAARIGMTIGIAMGTAMLWAPFFGFLGDKMNRVTHFVLGFLLAAIGYGWVGMQDDIVATSAIPSLIALGIGQSSVILTSTLILGQEAPKDLRGSVFGVQSFFGGIGILLISWAGGLLFDRFGPGSPFRWMAVCNVLIVAWGLWVLLRERARNVPALSGRYGG